ncbi:hypothetical protein [Stackebrandtia nassauensis]|uniref:Uncharacterized protein n=1 Tax=Stackebrandtia nassauensis (strain DSM 44728 / CIP 108903 / NRRL B-16338 / NBRC 102104 / LLR-40K-21) TaxID=446470 RepID=D3QAM1_STANL|nr:hypothetical protein [Stackebrandtia nassauensis]ADD42804.1 hypothetical protein Snas_3133 [Stackebrandtia nassauensis DSM 44728]
MTPTQQRLQPFYLAVPFTAVITGLFNLSETLPAPLALLAGAAWGIVLGLIATWLNTKATLSAWLEDGFVYLGIVGFAFAGCGGLMAILMLDGALGASSLTAEALEALFLPSIPYYIVVNSALELLVIPGLLYFGWRAGKRRVLILAAAGLYFAMRVWTYLAFVPARMGWAEAEHSGEALSAAERRQAASDLMVDDPRWILLLVMLAILLVAAYLPRVRERKTRTA